MAFNGTAKPAGWVAVTTPYHSHLFLTGQALAFTLGASTATSYEVRDFYGTVAAAGSVSGSTLTLSALPLGWYKLYLRRVTSDDVYGTLIGCLCFSVIRSDANLPSPPAFGTIATGNEASENPDQITKGIAGLGPHRLQVIPADDPTSGAYSVGAALSDKNFIDTWYESPPDSARPRPSFLQFPNGTTDSQAELDGVTLVVSESYPRVTHFEGPGNEPQGSPAADVVAQMQQFADAVHAGNAAAKAMGPGPVSFNGATLPWLDDFLAAGGADALDALSVHAYNCINRDLVMGRKAMDALRAVLVKHGLQDIEVWQTECGTFAAANGLFVPRRQATWALMQRMVLDQYGIPKERDYWFFDGEHGFWGFPSFWKAADGSVTPMIPLYRVFSQEVWGKEWAEALDFGDVENSIYIGSRYTDSSTGSSVITLMSNGIKDGVVSFSVSGASELTVVGPFGDTSTAECDAHVATVAVEDLPVYVRVPNGVDVSVKVKEYGPAILTWGSSAAGEGTGVDLTATDPRLLINGLFENNYYTSMYPYASEVPWHDDQDLPAAVTISLQAPRRIDTVVIHCPSPFQDEGSLTDYDLQYQDVGGSWHTLETVTEPTTTVDAPSSNDHFFCFLDSFYSDRCIFLHEFAPVLAQAIRINVRATTYGGNPNSDASDVDGEGTAYARIRLREIQVFCRDVLVPRPVILAT